MKKFILRLLLFCLLPIPLLCVLGYIVDSGLKRSRSFLFAEWNDIYAGKINADLLILGSSRAWVQFSPRILDSALHVSSYNLGMDGASFEVQYERLKIYLKHNKKPRYIIQEASPGTTFSAPDELPHFQQFLPYLSDSDMWKLVKCHYPSVGILEKYFPLYKYNNEPQLIKEGIACYLGHIPKGDKYKGYQGMNKSWDASFHQFVKLHPHGIRFKADSSAISLFTEYLDYCKANNITVILVNPPGYIAARSFLLNYNETQELITGIALAGHVPFLNYEQDSIVYDRSLFYNSQHMNRTGSELFSRKLATQLKSVVH